METYVEWFIRKESRAEYIYRERYIYIRVIYEERARESGKREMKSGV